MHKGKRYYKTLFSKVFAQNAKLFDNYKYTYTGSLILFRTIPHRNKIPEDLDAALDRNGKGIDELLEFYYRLRKNPYADEVTIKTVAAKTYSFEGKPIEMMKYERIHPENINKKFFKILLDDGNIRISYKIFGVVTELFPEKNGNGLTNLGTMDKKLTYINIKKGKKTLEIPMLSYKAIAQGYAMNFLKEIIQNNIYRFTDINSKPKDGMRLFSIISLLEKEGEDATPENVLKFIKKTVKEYSKIPQHYRSNYIDSAIKEFPWVKKMMQDIIKEYHAIIKRKNSKKYQFTSFYKKLGDYKHELNQYVTYLQKDMLTMLKKDILGEKYTITDVVTSFSHNTSIYNKDELKNITKNLQKIIKSINTIGIKNKNESFAYFYEMYMLKNLFIKPIKKIL